MKKMLLAGVAMLLLASVASAHPAARPPEHMTRLLHDCVDDYGGGDSLARAGYDLHSLEIFETRESGTQGVRFFINMNGEGPGKIEVKFGEFTGTYTYDSEWKSSQFNLIRIESANDGDRFILSGFVASTSLPTKASTFSMEGTYGNNRDLVNGLESADDSPLKTGCNKGSNPQAPFKLGTALLSGANKHLNVKVLASSKEVTPNTEAIFRISVTSPYSTSASSQQLTGSLRVLDGDAQARFHDSKSNDFSSTYSKSFTPTMKSDEIHIYAKGAASSSARIELTLTSSLGYADTHILNLKIDSDAVPEPSSTASKESPVGFFLPIIAIMGIALGKKRR